LPSLQTVQGKANGLSLKSLLPNLLPIMKKDDFEFSTLVELLRYRALNHPYGRAFTFLQDGETEVGCLTYQELDQQAQAIAVHLQSLSTLGERALLLYPSGLEFIASFFGCLYAGIIPVPAYPPRSNQSLARLHAIVADSQAMVALTTAEVLSTIERQLNQTTDFQSLRWVATDRCSREMAGTWQEPVLTPDTVAFLQYTSGSTGTPKGVIVSHKNILHNEYLIQLGFQHMETTIAVGWLPLFHDMGLIGNVLQPLYLGIPCFLMPPSAFLQKPSRWLQAISHYKATSSGGPNFAYDLCVQKVTPDQMANLDLSSWEVAFSGSEPIRAETIEQFSKIFEPCGFRHEAFYPCYGMAETTLIVSGSCKTAPPVLRTFNREALENNRIVAEARDNDGAQTLVSSGLPLKDFQTVIANPETLVRCAPEEIGEIWVAGPSVAKGYWRQEEETKRTFHAYLSDDGEGPFFRTGDLGFLQDGELFVTGRIKDLIIIRGQNHYPQDIEWSVGNCHEALQQGFGAAFSIDVEGKEQLVITQEVKRSYLRTLDSKEVFLNIRQVVAESHGLQTHHILLLKTGSIPKTSSGKIQRYACRARFLDSSLAPIANWSASSANGTNSRQLEVVRRA
jgi:acyl-CoA synthetase (AMP-forming)/AMP-acid ligase II